MLALHGWLDNAASFDRLAPLLPRHRVIALDLPGHGLSGHRPQQGTYNIWDDLPDLVALIEQLGLSRVALLGHSRGAIIAMLLAAVLGERVSQLVLLDGIISPPQEVTDTVDQLRRFAQDYSRPPGDRLRRYDSIEDAVAARCKATGISAQAARPIVERNLRRLDGAWAWRTDPRLRSASAVKFDRSQLAELLAAICAPGLLLVASGGIGGRFQRAPLLEHYAGLRIEEIDGEHHCHLLEQAVPMAQKIDAFLGADQG